MVWETKCSVIFLQFSVTFINLSYIIYFTVDVTVCHRGYHGDLNETCLIGSISLNAEKLVTVTWECLEKAINPGNFITFYYYLFNIF